MLAAKETTTLRQGTVLGYVSLLMWSLGAVMIASLKGIPTFEIIAIAYSIAFLLTAARLTAQRTWHRIRQPWLLWVIGLVGVFGNDAFYIAAFKYAPSAQVDLINYLWPVLVILFAGFLPKERVRPTHVLAAIMGLAAVALLINKDIQLLQFHAAYWTGYSLAFLDAVVWAIYTLAARYYGNTPTEMIGMYCGLGALCAIVTHYQVEPTVMPTLSELALIVFMGLTTQGLALFLWDIGVKYGNYKLLTVLSYANPAISVALLILFGKSTYSTELLVSCALISVASFLAFRTTQDA